MESPIRKGLVKAFVRVGNPALVASVLISPLHPSLYFHIHASSQCREPLQNENWKDKPLINRGSKAAFWGLIMCPALFLCLAKTHFASLWTCFPLGFHFWDYFKTNYIQVLVSFAHISLNTIRVSEYLEPGSCILPPLNAQLEMLKFSLEKNHYIWMG